MINFENDKIITVYSFDQNKIYCGSFEYHWAKGTGLAANSTNIQPPEFSEGFIPVFVNGDWKIQQDHRGKTVYSIADQSEIKVDYVGNIKEGFTESKPASIFDTWNGTHWVDQRTAEEIAAYNRLQFQKLSKRQFALYLYDHDMYDQVMQAIEANPRFKIEFDTVADIERLGPTVSAMTQLLGWTDEQVDAMWIEALTL